MELKHPMLFLANHLLDIETNDLVELEKPQICAFSGIQSTKVVPIKKALSGNFTDWTYLVHDSNYISYEAYKSLKNTLLLPDGKIGDVRMYSYYCDSDTLKVLHHSQRMDALLGPKNPPFLFIIGNLYASKAQKHVIYKSVLSTDAENFFVCTEAGNVEVNMSQVRQILPTLQAWYSLPEGSKTPYFTKTEILNGCENVKKIEAYGIQKYFEENAKIKPHRGSMFLDLLVNFLQIKTN